MPVGRHFKAGIVSGALALGLLVGGCGGDDDGDDPSGGSGGPGLAAGLEGVNVVDVDAPLDLNWADTARLREAAGIPPDSRDAASNSRWRIPIAYASGDALADILFAQDFGFDPLTGDRTIDIGVPPDQATFYGGVETDDIGGALDDLGYEEQDGFLANGTEKEILPGSPSLIGLNRFAIDGDDVAVGPSEPPVAAALGREGEPITSIEGVTAASDCLGSGALIADVRDPEEGAGAAVVLQAIGVEAPDEDGVVREVLCVVGAPGESLGTVADCMDGTFNEGGIDPFSNAPFEDFLGEVEVTEGESEGTAWARAAVSPPADDPVGILLNLDSKRSLAAALGGDPFAGAGPGLTPKAAEALEAELPDVC